MLNRHPEKVTLVEINHPGPSCTPNLGSSSKINLIRFAFSVPFFITSRRASERVELLHAA
jgi:hypothetical protein